MNVAHVHWSHFGDWGSEHTWKWGLRWSVSVSPPQLSSSCCCCLHQLVSQPPLLHRPSLCCLSCEQPGRQINNQAKYSQVCHPSCRPLHPRSTCSCCRTTPTPPHTDTANPQRLMTTDTLSPNTLNWRLQLQSKHMLYCTSFLLTWTEAGSRIWTKRLYVMRVRTWFGSRWLA